MQALSAFCLAMAMVGIVLPVMPTLPFLIAAAWTAARSSPALHRWLLAHRRFGPVLRDWDEAGVVSRPVKCFATAMMAVSAGSMPVLIPAGLLPAAAAIAAAMIAILVWLWRRPERRPE